VSGDTQLLEQALSNLINNAIKYSGSPDLELSLTKDENMAVISVLDHGCGIPKESCPRIFERFYRVHKERSRALGGTGLGLAIVKHIAQLHGGKAELSSVLGKGCCFKMYLAGIVS
jgi:signal transduction histidine kinase